MGRKEAQRLFVWNTMIDGSVSQSFEGGRGPKNLLDAKTLWFRNKFPFLYNILRILTFWQSTLSLHRVHLYSQEQWLRTTDLWSQMTILCFSNLGISIIQSESKYTNCAAVNQLQNWLWLYWKIFVIIWAFCPTTVFFLSFVPLFGPNDNLRSTSRGILNWTKLYRTKNRTKD